MARYKKMRHARRAGGFMKKASRRGGVGKSANLIQLDAMLYGAVRAPVSNWLASIVPMPVIGQVGDEVIMGLANYLIAKNTGGMIRDVAIKGLVVENARLGEAVVGMTGLAGIGGTSNGPQLLGSDKWQQQHSQLLLFFKEVRELYSIPESP